MTQKLLIYQSLWAMERRRPDGHEWDLQEKLRMIRDAGFDGAGVRFAEHDYVSEVTQFLRDHDMTWQAQAYPQTIDDLKPILEHVLKFGADHLNVQPDVRPYTVQECIPLIMGWRELAAQAGVRMHIETHRNRMTTDLFFTLHLLDAIPDLRMISAGVFMDGSRAVSRFNCNCRFHSISIGWLFLWTGGGAVLSNGVKRLVQMKPLRFCVSLARLSTP